MSDIIKDTQSAAFVENNCKIDFGGREFSAGGSWMLRRKDTGKMEALLYISKKEEVYIDTTGHNWGKVTRLYLGSWDGSLKVQVAYRGSEYRSNFGDIRQSVWFRWNGLYFHGIWYKSGSDIVRARQITEKSYYS